MPVLNVKIKHAGNAYDVELDTDLPGIAFKEAIYQKTGVPVDRMKVMVKGGMLKVCWWLISIKIISLYPLLFQG